MGFFASSYWLKVENGHNTVLHRDVYWLGRQWAVTGYGVQAVSKRHKMRFDVDATRIWANDLEEALRAEPWFDAADFQQALSVARKRALENPLSFTMPPGDEK